MVLFSQQLAFKVATHQVPMKGLKAANHILPPPLPSFLGAIDVTNANHELSPTALTRWCIAHGQRATFAVPTARLPTDHKVDQGDYIVCQQKNVYNSPERFAEPFVGG